MIKWALEGWVSMAARQDSEKNKPLVLFVGTDENYWNNLRERFDDGMSLSYYRFGDVGIKDSSYLDVFFKILEEKPKILYIDFSGKEKQSMLLARLLIQDKTLKGVPLIGLAAGKEQARQYLAVGMDIVHIKCGEYHDVVYDATYLFSQSNVVSKQFARAKIKDMEIDLVDDFKVGFIASDYVHIEGDLLLEKEEEVSLDLDIPNNIVPSRKFIVRKIYDSPIYYGFRYAYDLDFVYVDKPDNEDLYSEEEATLESEELDDRQKKKIHGEFELKRKKRLDDYEDDLKISKKRLDKWIHQNSYSSVSKLTRVLILDERLELLKDPEARGYFEKSPFSVRFLTGLDEELVLLGRFKPNLIFVQHSHFDIEALRADGRSEEAIVEDYIALVCAGNERLGNCLAKIRGIEGYEPLLVVFNCADFSEYFDSQKWAETEIPSIKFDYPKIMLCKESLNRKALIEMSERYDEQRRQSERRKTAEKIAALKKKDPVKYGRLTPGNLEEKRYYITRNNPLSLAAMHHRARLLSLSESDIQIGIERTLAMVSYRIHSPVSMSLRLVPVRDKDYEEQGKMKIYKGLIHAVGEGDKEDIRKQVNDVFCASSAEQRQKELENFRQLNAKRAAEIARSRQALEEQSKKDLGMDDGGDGQGQDGDGDGDGDGAQEE